MSFAPAQRDRWQRQVRNMLPRQTQLDQANYLRDQREAAARTFLRARENLSNLTAAYLEACRQAGINPR